MAVTLAGVPLCLFGRGAGEFVSRYCPWDVPAHFAPDYSRNGLQHLPWSAPPHEPPPRIGVLRWPTGACRWATAHFLVTDAELDLFDAADSTKLWTSAGPQARTLALSDTADGTGGVECSMYALPPRPLGTPRDYPQATGTDELGLYLLTLVDARYFWWWKSAAVEAGGTWAELFAEIGAGLGETISLATAVEAAFESPDDAWAVGRQPLPILLDAAAQAVGRRVVRKLDGTVLVQTYEEAREAQDAVLELDRTAGGRFNPDHLARAVPDRLAVVSPDGFTATEITLASLALDEFDGVSGFAGSLAVNAGIVAASSGYAAALAEDWYLWRLADLDWVSPGVADVEPCGLFDAVEWEAHADNPAEPHRSRLGLTRVMRPAWDDGVTNARPDPDCCDGTTTSTTTTTTTRAPCTGTCEFEWDDTLKVWTGTSDGCSDGCACLWPSFCGESDGDVTTTYCTYWGGWPPTCGQTTTTCPPTTTTTTTTASCVGFCTWIWDDEDGWYITGTCAGTLDTPVLWASPFWSAACGSCEPPDTATTPECGAGFATICVVTTTTPAPPPPPCGGTCRWWCGPLSTAWEWKNEGACQGGYGFCGCEPPSVPCAGSCSWAETPCLEPDRYDPCDGTTTTTTGACGDPCLYRGDGAGGWDLVEGTECVGGCDCEEPPYESSGTSETASSVCAGTPTTTTTTTLAPCTVGDDYCVTLDGGGAGAGGDADECPADGSYQFTEDDLFADDGTVRVWREESYRGVCLHRKELFVTYGSAPPSVAFVYTVECGGATRTATYSKTTYCPLPWPLELGLIDSDGFGSCTLGSATADEGTCPALPTTTTTSTTTTTTTPDPGTTTTTTTECDLPCVWRWYDGTWVLFRNEGVTGWDHCRESSGCPGCLAAPGTPGTYVMERREIPCGSTTTSTTTTSTTTTTTGECSAQCIFQSELVDDQWAWVNRTDDFGNFGPCASPTCACEEPAGDAEENAGNFEVTACAPATTTTSDPSTTTTGGLTTVPPTSLPPP
jgi:hypothetical protein